jgi:hypothetical protein
MKFNKEDLVLLIDEKEAPGFEIIKDELVEYYKGENWLMVFKYQSRFYELGYLRHDDIDTLDYEPDYIECTEVKPVEEVVARYVPV